MIESCENLVQTAVLTLCAVIASYRVVRRKSRAWTLLAFFYGSWLLGNCYWLCCLIFYGRPQVSAVSDLSWCASYLFLYLLLRQTSPEAGKAKRLTPWLGPAFTAAMAVFFMQWGKWISNLVYAGLMGGLLYAVLARLTERKRDGARTLCAVIFVFCLAEYALWTSSCLFEEESLANPYYWCDILLTALFPFFLPATKKAVA